MDQRKCKSKSLSFNQRPLTVSQPPLRLTLLSYHMEHPLSLYFQNDPRLVILHDHDSLWIALFGNLFIQQGLDLDLTIHSALSLNQVRICQNSLEILKNLTIIRHLGCCWSLNELGSVSCVCRVEVTVQNRKIPENCLTMTQLFSGTWLR